MDNVLEMPHSAGPEPPPPPARGSPRKLARADRPCDVCRRRKSKCVKDSARDKCVLCIFHGHDCTYLDAPAPKQRRRAGPDGPGAAQQRHRQKRLKAFPASTGGDHPARPHHPPVAAVAVVAPGSGGSLLDRTLGLHQTAHFRYIGSSSFHEPKLLELIHSGYSHSEPGDDGQQQEQQQQPADDLLLPKFRQVDRCTTFIARSDRQAPRSWEAEEELEAIESLVRPHGPALVDLYFRVVHPSYPIIHKGVFLEKSARSYSEFAPALLAAMYLLAMDWWEYDRALSAHGRKPDADALLRVAIRSTAGAMQRPKLSSAQAGLLLLQRSGGDSWVLTTQLVAVGEELGLHVDCSSWDIPEWEKGLRRRLGWAIYMQDKWGALIHGRPSHISAAGWDLPAIGLEDFPESEANDGHEEGSTEAEKGRMLFVQLAALTRILARILDCLYPTDRTRIPRLVAGSGVQGLLEFVKPLAVELKEWAGRLPAMLRMEDVQARKLCSNGYLHLSYFVAEIVIHRCIIRSMTPETPPDLRALCREAGKARLEHAIGFVHTLRPEHLQGFWWFAAPKSLVFVRTYGGLLWATSGASDGGEAEFYRRRLEDFRWALRVRAKGVGFVTAALQEMDDNLQDLNMSQQPPAACGSSGTSSGGSSSSGTRQDGGGGRRRLRRRRMLQQQQQSPVPSESETLAAIGLLDSPDDSDFFAGGEIGYPA